MRLWTCSFGFSYISFASYFSPSDSSFRRLGKRMRWRVSHPLTWAKEGGSELFLVSSRPIIFFPSSLLLDLVVRRSCRWGNMGRRLDGVHTQVSGGVRTTLWKSDEISGLGRLATGSPWRGSSFLFLSSPYRSSFLYGMLPLRRVRNLKHCIQIQGP